MIHEVTCIGVGTIGCGWATSFALSGCRVRLYDQFPAAVEAAPGRVRENLFSLVKNGVLTEEKAQLALENLVPCSDFPSAVSGSEWIQESAFESYDVKQQLLTEIDAYCGADTIIASSSSGLSAQKIAALSKFPQRCLVVHPYNPVYLMPLVEIVSATNDQNTLQKACEFLQAIGKEPAVLKREAPGFIANRLQMAVQREICHMVYEGIADVEACDKAMLFGLAPRWAVLGPMLITHLGSKNAKTMIDTLNPATEAWLADMADFKEWGDVCQAGVDLELAHRDPSIGNTTEGIREFRDKNLLKILAMHGKLRW